MWSELLRCFCGIAVITLVVGRRTHSNPHPRRRTNQVLLLIDGIEVPDAVKTGEFEPVKVLRAQEYRQKIEVLRSENNRL